MRKQEESHECPVCGQEHVHTVEVYQFDTHNLGLGELLINKGPVTLVVDKYGDWSIDADDGYTVVGKYWDSASDMIVVRVVEIGGEI